MQKANLHILKSLKLRFNLTKFNIAFFFVTENGLFLCISSDPVLHLPVLRQVNIYELIL